MDYVTNYVKETAVNAAADGTYHLSKHVFYGAAELATFLGDKLAMLPDYLINTAADHSYGSIPHINFYNGTKSFVAAHQPFSHINEIATKMLAPEAYKMAQEHAALGIEPFQAADLIGAALLLGCSSIKATENVWQAALKIKYLLTGKRNIITHYEIPLQSKLSTGSITVIEENNFFAGKLLLHAGFDFAWAIGWSGVNYLARRGILRALAQAGNSEAATVFNAISIGAFALPLVFEAAKSLATAKRSAVDGNTRADSATLLAGNQYDLTNPDEDHGFEAIHFAEHYDEDGNKCTWNPFTDKWEPKGEIADSPFDDDSDF